MEASQRDLVGGRYTDVVLVPGDVGPTTLHSLLLSAASPFLCTLLSSMRLNDGWMKPIEFSNKETTGYAGGKGRKRDFILSEGG